MRLKKILNQAYQSIGPKIDKNPVYLGGNTYYASKFGVLIGLLIFVIIIIYTIQKLFFVYFSDQNIIISQQTLNNDPSIVNMSNWNFTFVFGNNQGILKIQDFYSQGINATVSLKTLGDRGYKSKLIDCGQNDGRLCIDQSKTPLHIQGNKNYNPSYQSYHQLQILITKCQPLFDSSCKLYPLDKPNRYFMTFQFQSPLYNPFELNFDSPSIWNAHSFQFLQLMDTYSNTTKTLKYDFDVSKSNCTSDLSILPSAFSKSIKQTQSGILTGHTKVQQQMKQYLISDIFFEIKFRRSMNTNIYTRKKHKIDQLFAGILGMMSALTLAAKILLSNYNKWASQQKIIKQIQKKQSQKSFISYFLLLLKRQKRSRRQQQILKQIYKTSIQKFVEKQQKQIQFQVLKERLNEIQKQLKLINNQKKCRQKVQQRYIKDTQQRSNNYQPLNQSLLSQQK